MAEERTYTEEESAPKAFQLPSRTKFEAFKKEELLPTLQSLKEKRHEHQEALEDFRSSSMYKSGLNVVFGLGISLGLVYLYLIGGSTFSLFYFLAYGIFFWSSLRFLIPKGSIEQRTAKAFLIAAAVPILFMGILTPLLIYAGFATVILEVGGRMGFSGKHKAEYIEHYKKNLIGRTIKFISGDLEYEPLGGVSEEAVQHSLLFPFKGKHFSSEDRVVGKVGGMDVEFCELFISSTVVKKLGEIYFSQEQRANAERQWHYLHKKTGDVMFQGLLFIADFHKEFSGMTVVRPREFQWTMEKMGKDRKRGREGRKDPNKGKVWWMNYDPSRRLEDPESGTELKKVGLEDPDFEERYNVYSTDQVSARYILSTTMMEQIKSFADKWGKAIFLSFKDSKMQLAIEEKGGIFDPRMANTGGTEKEEEQLDHYYSDLERIFGIVDELRLNDRIWAKG